jgi:hypothetical protein
MRYLSLFNKFNNIITEQAKEKEDVVVDLPEINIQGKKFNTERNPEFETIEYASKNTLADIFEAGKVKPFEHKGELYKQITFSMTKQTKGIKATATSYKKRLYVTVYKKGDDNLIKDIEKILTKNGLKDVYPSEGSIYWVVGGSYDKASQAIQALARLSMAYDWVSIEPISSEQ